MTGYDGELLQFFCFGGEQLTIAIDRLQFTVTSRKEMPNARFVEEIAKAADDLLALHNEVITTTKPRL
jgi:carnitine O-acetyltransferase